MKEKRPLVWLSAPHPNFSAQDAIGQDWQLIPVTIAAEPPDDISNQSSRVGVFDLSNLSGSQLTLLGTWLEALPVDHWVAVLEPEQIDHAAICGLINRYCSDYHKLPIQPDRFHGILGHLWGMSELHTKALSGIPLSYHDFALEGESLVIRQARELLRKFAGTDEPVLIYGENGTGKEAAAKFIHHNSPRKNKPLIVINCAALPPSLTENELFGHEKGAFTHALSARKGRIEAADGGTLLLDGVNEFNCEQQSAILRFLQDGEIERIGSSRPTRVDARLIATSISPLDDLVASGRFRSDVFYRLGNLHVRLPPLRERKEDIVPLANRMLSASPSPARPRRLADNVAICLGDHPWPGNLRELQNRLRQALLLAEGPIIETADMGFAKTPGDNQRRSQELSLGAFRSQADRRAVSVSMALAQNNISVAARLLNISRASFYRLMSRCQHPNDPSDFPSNNE